MNRDNNLNNESKKNRKKIAIGATAVIVAGGGIIGYAVYQNYQSIYGTYCKVGEHEISKLEYDFFYNSTVNNFLNSYKDYISYLGLDTNKSFSEQEYEDGVTWEQYFQSQTLEFMKEIFIVYDLASEDKFDSKDKSYNSFFEQLKDHAKEHEETEEDALKEIYGENATKKNLDTILKQYFTAVDYVTKLQSKDLVPSDKEIDEFYASNKDDYDSVSYRVFTVSANPEKKSDDTTKSSAEEKDSLKKSETSNTEEKGSESSVTEEKGSESSVTEKKESSKTSEASSTEEKESSKNSETKESVSSSENNDSKEDSSTKIDNSGEETTVEYSDEEWEAAMKIANKTAEEFFDQVYDEETFKELCVKYAVDENSKAAYEKEDTSLVEKSTKANANSAIAEWLFDSQRKKDATAVIEDKDNHVYYIVYFIDRERDDTPTVDARHILISPEEVAALGENPTDEEKTAYEKKVKTADTDAKKKAESILKEWKSGDATEESFSKLADKNSSDNSEGGLYQKIAPGDMVTEFNDWCFNKDRKEGDTDIVKTDYGYHIMYYIGQEDPVWKNNISNSLISTSYNELISNKINGYKFEDIKGSLEYLTNLQKEKVSNSKTEENSSTNSETTSNKSSDSSQSTNDEKSDKSSEEEMTEKKSDNTNSKSESTSTEQKTTE